MSIPYLSQNKTFRQPVQAFKGLNMNPKAQDGEWYTTTNLSASAFPCMYPRAKRGSVATITNPYALGGNHAALAYVVTIYSCRVDVSDTEEGWYAALPAEDIAAFNAGALALVWYNNDTAIFKKLLTLSSVGVATWGTAQGSLQAAIGTLPGTVYIITAAASEADWLLGTGIMNVALYIEGSADLYWKDTSAGGVYKKLLGVDETYTWGVPSATLHVPSVYALYYNGADTGVTLSSSTEERTIISFGAYLLVFPDKVYYNTVDDTDKGSIEATFTTTGDIEYTICRDDGTDYDTADVTAADEPPAAPDNGDYWIDTSAEIDTLMQYSSYSQSWVSIPTVYTKIANTGIGASFAEYDAVTISGAAYGGADPKLAIQIPALNGSKMVYAAGNDYIIVIGLLDAVYTQSSGAVTVSRTIPDMDYVAVSGNRVWGCYYGVNDDDETVNEIYASRLGDFKNFASFMGISTDSYAVTVGQGGPWTGATSHLGYPIFFKERCLYKVYGTRPSNFQVMDTACAGVQSGSSKSIQIINSTLFYLSSDGEVVSYDGAMPSSAFAPFGANRYTAGIAGSLDGVYYLSCMDSASAYHLFTYNTRKNLWFREDTFRPIGFQFLTGELYALTSTTLWAMRGKSGTLETSLAWSATSGLIGWETPDMKYISRFIFRVEMPTSSSILLEIEYNSSGSWVSMNGKTVTTPATAGTFMLPVIPYRCDHFRMKISGTGLVKVWSMDKEFELGGDGFAHI